MFGHGDRALSLSKNLTPRTWPAMCFNRCRSRSTCSLVIRWRDRCPHSHPDGYSHAKVVVLEDPPGLTGELAHRGVADDLERSVRSAREAPAETTAALLQLNPRWSQLDAEQAVASRAALDLPCVTRLLRSTRWDLQALVADCPIPVYLLLAAHDSALEDPDRAALENLLPSDRRVLIESGHSVHRDRPGLWLYNVLKADREAR